MQRGVTQIEGGATAFGLAGDEFGRMHELSAIDLQGPELRAVSQEPLRAGLEVSIGFESRSLMARRGVVRACEPDAGQFRVFIEIDSRLAA
jgi:hypothetical protein